MNIAYWRVASDNYCSHYPSKAQTLPSSFSSLLSWFWFISPQEFQILRIEMKQSHYSATYNIPPKMYFRFIKDKETIDRMLPATTIFSLDKKPFWWIWRYFLSGLLSYACRFSLQRSDKTNGFGLMPGLTQDGIVLQHLSKGLIDSKPTQYGKNLFLRKSAHLIWLLIQLNPERHGKESKLTNEARGKSTINIVSYYHHDKENHNQSWPAFIIDLDLAFKDQRERSSRARSKDRHKSLLW